jgi:hypothetical protein
MDDVECGALSGMLDRGNQSFRIKSAPVPLCPQISHDLTRARTRTAAVGNQPSSEGKNATASLCG